MSKTRTAVRMENIAPFYVMDLLTRAKEMEARGRSVIHMEVGEPDFVTAEPVIEAGKAALDAGHTGYTPATGIPELRKAISDHYLAHFDVEINPKRIVVTPGASGALQLVLSVLVDPGQEVLMADPGYPCNKNFVELVSGVPVCLPVGPESRYQLDAEQIDGAWSPRTRAAMIASPSNPTGTLVPRSELRNIYDLVTAKGGHLIVDEIYQGLVYGADCYSALSISDNLFVINSFSKYFGMTGWRVGWLVAPESYIKPLDTLAQNIFISSAAPSQYAALRAISSDCRHILETRKEEFKKRRDYLLPALKRLGFDIPVVPEGAFYLYANCSNLTGDSFAFAYDLLDSEGVAVTPGKDFGANKPEQYLRFAYTTDIEQMKEGVRRIKRFLDKTNNL
ncbi:MAG: pyridoxal phosphate-dependent aminotransferase [Desulforhopalus sp.]